MNNFYSNFNFNSLKPEINKYILILFMKKRKDKIKIKLNI